jgi:hypothetical protein
MHLSAFIDRSGSLLIYSMVNTILKVTKNPGSFTIHELWIDEKDKKIECINKFCGSVMR